jgi:hypothetical protein
MSDLECQLSAERSRRISDAEEWRQFQADLLMTVRVANDFQVQKYNNNKVIMEDSCLYFFN